MRFTWHEKKRRSNLKDHGLDFADAPWVFEGPTFTYEDDRFDYGEERFVTLGLLAGIPVSIVHTETEHPEADLKHIVRGIARRGLQPARSKASISLRVDRDVLEWFKAQGPGYQTKMNAVLRAFRDASA
ncbi:MAG: BrnA antitoxin family protein [Candidatus Hydrogenedentes bacterium]|nr:BrnA antitoxin family protein [Candidatus Hydrogenedentota bacterium]